MVQTRASTKEIESGEGSILEPSPTKKHRAGNLEEPLKERHGKPTGRFCQLNLDVLFLVASYFHPLDLLNLARTCRSLRQLLMDKSSVFVWKAARQQVEGLPPCPDDLTEPEYADLAFCARCHGCGKHAKKILWALRRRYCVACRSKRLYNINLCPYFMRFVHPSEALIGDGSGEWVDKEQKDSFQKEHNDASDKAQFLKEKRNQLHDIKIHASNCKGWQRREASRRRSELDILRRARCDSILERLRQHGYAPEIEYFGTHEIEASHTFTSKPLTDKAWADVWPELLEIMNDFRYQRLEATVYQPRRKLLASEYATYLKSTLSSTTAIEFLPDLQDLQSFIGFEEVINAPESAKLDTKPFEFAFTLLPVLVGQWRVQLDDELAGLVITSSHFPDSTPRGGISSSKVLGSSLACVDKLHLACAVFRRGCDLASYPDILFLPDQVHSTGSQGNMEGTISRLGIQFVKEAPYIVHACGLDPNVAKPEDMDHRNARLKCLLCDSSIVMDWKYALWHAHFWCRKRHLTSSRSSPWLQLVSDEHIEAIQAIEAYSNNSPRYMRCLLCHPCIGNGLDRYQLKDHLVHTHNMKREAIRQDLYSGPISTLCERWRRPGHVTVRMVEKGGRVTFQVG